ncbi:MAG: hypothetical protein JST52_00795 [Bacteroidetes bacterium]|nr:hypothetical protein [Bacteroidota bacterium]MBS1740338.1 hypothetical protein [Bacteroidota bacterium]MBS1776840.1 hypothetical protein [Bacteroidota bacterium]
MKLKFLLLPLLGLFITFASCKKDSPAPTPTPTPTADANETMNNTINGGTWSISTFTANGTEIIQSVYQAIKMDYKKEDKTNGTSTWTLIEMGGATKIESHKYSIRNNGTELQIDSDILSISVSGGTMTLSGNLGGISTIIKAKK